MKRKTTKLFFLFLITILAFSIVLGMTACDDKTPTNSNNEQTSPEEDAAIAFTNGDFSLFTTGVAPMRPTSWSQYSSAVTGAYKSGIINVSEDIYSADKTAWDSIDNPGKPVVPNDVNGEPIEGYDDDYIMMLYNISKTANYYGNSTFSIEKGAYYKFTVAVKTVNVDGTGAVIDFSSGAYKTFKNINTNGEWVYYSFYVRGSSIEDTSLTVRLYLGYGAASSSSNADLTMGYAFFDNFIAEEITSTQYVAGLDSINSETMETIAAYNLTLPDSGFTAAATTTNVVNTSPRGWADDSNPYYTNNSGDITDGIIDATQWSDILSKYPNINNWQDLGEAIKLPTIPGWKTENVEVDSILTEQMVYDDLQGTYNFDSSLYMIANRYEAAFGIKGGRSISIAPGEYYTLSLWILTDGITSVYEALNANEGEDERPEGSSSDVTKKGAAIILSNGTDAKFECINTEGVWKQYTFYFEGSTSRSTEIDLSLWLGQGNSDDKEKLTIGVAFFDFLELNAISKSDYDQATEDNTIQKVSLKTEADRIIFDNSDKVAQVESGVSKDVVDSGSDFEQVNIPGAHLATEDAWNAAASAYAAYNISEFPASPINNTDFIVSMLSNNTLTASTITFQSAKISPNKFYRVALYAKTMDLKGSGTITIALKEKDNDSALSSFTSVNTSSYTNRLTNNYAEYIFYVQGGGLTDLSEKEVYIEITMGSGTKVSTGSFLMGKLFISDFNMEEISYDEYNNVKTGTYIKTYAFSTSSSALTNGNFDSVDYADAEYYTKEDAENPELKVKEGDLKSLIKPSTWTIVTDGEETYDEDSLAYGVVNLYSKQILKDLGLISDATYNADQDDYYELAKNEVYNAWVLGTTEKLDKPYGANNFFVFDTYEGSQSKPVGIKSSSISLSASSYYVIKVAVKTIGTSTASIRLTNSSDADSLKFANIGTSDSWDVYTFAVKTSLQSVSVNLELFFGNIDEDTATDGTVLYDNATYYTITEDEYNDLVASGNLAIANYETNSFDLEVTSATTSFTQLQTPDLFTISDSGKANEEDSESVGGIVNKTYSDRTVVMGTKADSTQEELDSVLDENTWNWIFANDGMDNMSVGNNVLAINNIVKSQNSIKNTTAWKLTGNTYYEISIYVKTAQLAKSSGAKLVLAVGDTYDSVNDADYTAGEDDNFAFYILDNINTSTYGDEDAETLGEWTKCSFYIKTNSDGLSTVYLYMFLGEKSKDYTEAEAREELGIPDDDTTTTVDKTNRSKYVQGYAFFDNLTIKEITSQAFEAEQNTFETADETYLANNVVKVYDEVEDDDDDDDDDDDTVQVQDDGWTNSQFFWLYITSIIIGALLLLAIIAFIIRKNLPALSKKVSAKKLSKNAPAYDKSKSEKSAKSKKVDIKNNDDKNDDSFMD